MVFLKDFFEKVDFENNQKTSKKEGNWSVVNELTVLDVFFFFFVVFFVGGGCLVNGYDECMRAGSLKTSLPA